MFFKHLRLELGKRMRRRIPETTLRRWLRQTGIGPRRQFSEADLHVLDYYGKRLQQGYSAADAKDQLIHYLTHEYEENPNSTARTIEVEATAI